MACAKLLLAVVSVAGCAAQAPVHSTTEVPAYSAPPRAMVKSSEPAATEGATIAGQVQRADNRGGIPNAIVILQSTALPSTRETQTNAKGLYLFTNLPPGTYTVQVLAGYADVSKVTTLPEGARFRANFRLDPEREPIICRLPAGRPSLRESLLSVDAEEARLRHMPKTILVR